MIEGNCFHLCIPHGILQSSRHDLEKRVHRIVNYAWKIANKDRTRTKNMTGL